MEIFSSNQKMVDLLRTNHNLLPVLNHFGLKLGFRDLTISELCAQEGINSDFFLAITNTYHNKDYFPERELLSFSPLEIVSYLKNTHIYYLSYILPKMERILDRLLNQDDSDSQDLKMIELFYRNYKEELVQHIREEEELVFPYIINLLNDPENLIKHPGIHSFEKEHSNVEIKLNDLKNLILKYVNPNYDQKTCIEFLNVLFSFEKDITNHARIEDKILVPIVIDLEKKIRS